MSTMEYPPEDREPTPRGASKAAEVEESRADMWCMCAIEARARTRLPRAGARSSPITLIEEA